MFLLEMIIMVLLSNLLTTISAVFVPYHSQLPYHNTRYVDDSFYTPPFLVEQEAYRNIPEQWSFIEEDNIGGGRNYEDYTDFVPGIPRTLFDYDNKYSPTIGGTYQKHVLPNSELVGNQFIDRFDVPHQVGSTNCEPLVDRYTNEGYGSENSEFYGPALPYIDTSEYLENPNNLRNQDFIREIRHRSEKRIRKYLGKLRHIHYRNNHGYLSNLDNLYRPNFLRNSDIFDRSSNRPMLHKSSRTLFIPQGPTQHIISFLDRLQNRHFPSLVHHFHRPNEYIQWLPNIWTHKYRPVPDDQHMITQHFVDNRFDGNGNTLSTGPVNGNKKPDINIRFDSNQDEVTSEQKDQNNGGEIIKVEGDQKGVQVGPTTESTNPLGEAQINAFGNNLNRYPPSFGQYFQYPNGSYQSSPYPETHEHQPSPADQYLIREPLVGNHLNEKEKPEIIGIVNEIKNTRNPNINMQFDDGQVKVSTIGNNKNENIVGGVINVEGNQKGSQALKMDESIISNTDVPLREGNNFNKMVWYNCIDMSSDYESMDSDIELAANNAIQILIPTKSRNRYDSNTVQILSAYFARKAEKEKASSLWTHSMLRTIISVKKNVDISKYTQLLAFLKRKSEGRKPKKSIIFSKNSIEIENYNFSIASS